jgi:hypothetical protein
MPSALPYQISHGTVGVPLIIPTKSGNRCGHYTPVTTPSGAQGYRLVRDPNAVCGLPTKTANVQVCVANPSACANVPLPPGWQQVGQTAITGRTPGERLGSVAIR